MAETYSVYGLLVSSELPLPDLGSPVGNPGAADVVIRFGTLPPPTEPSPLPYGLWRDGDRCGVEVPDVGRYEARHGREIVVDPLPGAEPRAIRLFLLGSMMGAVMMQRGHLVLHGNAIRVGRGADQACAVVLGHSGSGKSTLAAEFHRRGFDVLSDDVVPVDLSGSGPGLALPGYPRIKLWEDALERLGTPTADLERISDEHEKFQLHLSRGEIGPLPVRWIYVLERHAGQDVRLEPVHGALTFGLLFEHTYRNELVHGEDAVAAHLQLCARLVRGARVTRLSRPAGTMSVEASAEAVLADLQESA